MKRGERSIRQIVTPLVFGGVLLLVYLAVSLFDEAWSERVAEPYFRAALYAALGVVVVRVIVFLLLEVGFRRVKGKQAPALLHALVALPLYLVVLAAILSGIFNTNLGGLLATSAIATVVLGLALQETLGNFFAGISIQIEQPFQIGDAIRVDGLIGRVDTLNWRTTSIRTIDNVVVVFPNSKIASTPLEVYGRTELNRRTVEFPAPYGERPERVIALVEEAVRSLPLVSAERPPQVRIRTFTDSGVIYEVLYWIRDYMDAPSVDAAVMKRVWYVFCRHRIEIPLPHQVQVFPTVRPEEPVPPEEAYERILAQNPFFEPLSVEQRRQVAAQVEPIVFGPGEPIIRYGDAGDSMFILRRGHVEIRLPVADGRRAPVARLGPGDFFGEMALFTGEPRSADVVAVGEVEVLEIEKEDLQDVVAENPRLAEQFSRMIEERRANLETRTAEGPEQGDGRSEGQESILGRILHFFDLA